MEKVGPNGLGTTATARLITTSAATGAVIGALVGLVWAAVAIGVLQGPPVIGERDIGSAVLVLVVGFAVFALVGATALGVVGAVVGLVIGVAASRGVNELPVLEALIVVAAVLLGDPYGVARGFTLTVQPVDLSLEMVVGLAVPLVLGVVAAAYHGWAIRRLVGVPVPPMPALVEERRPALVARTL